MDEIIKYLINVCFTDTIARKHIKKYKESLNEIFELQANLVIYPDAKATCFKFRNKTYFNPVFENLYENQIEVNLRHLHPSLMDKMTAVEKDFLEVGMTQRRLESFLKRALNKLSFNLFNIPSACPHSNIDLNTNTIIAEIKKFFLFMTVNKIFPINQIQIELNNVISSFRAYITNYKDIFKKIENIVDEFIEEESTTVQSFNEFKFKVNVLGL